MRHEIELRLQDLTRIVSQHGYAVVGLEGDRGLPPKAHTVGCSLRGLPDLIVIGLPVNVATSAVNAAYDVMAKNWPFRSRTKFTGIVADYECALRDASRSDLLKGPMALAKAFNARHGVESAGILQICWPDKNGIQPFEPGCDIGIARVQRVPSLR